MANRAIRCASRSGSTCCSCTSCVLQNGHHSALRWKTTRALRPARAACKSTWAPRWSGSRMSGRRSPSRGPIFSKSLGRSWVMFLLSDGQHLVPGLERGGPTDLDGILHALVRWAALRMRGQGPLRRLPRLRRHGEFVVHVNGFDVDGLPDARDPAFHGGDEGLAVERDLAPCQGATQGAVHSPGDGGHHVVEGRGDRGALRDSVVLAQAALDAIDHGRRDVPEIGVTIAVAILET